GSLGLAVVRIAVAGGRIAAPFAVIGRGLDRAIALPAFLQPGLGTGFQVVFSIILACSPRIMGTNSYRISSRFKLPAVLADRRIGVLQAEFFAHRSLFGDFQK